MFYKIGIKCEQIRREINGYIWPQHPGIFKFRVSALALVNQQVPWKTFKIQEKIKRNITVHALLKAFLTLIFTFANIYQSFRPIDENYRYLYFDTPSMGFYTARGPSKNSKAWFGFHYGLA